jgi:two-component system, OmpR family, copper resistance phosphate regulon response regulator CusR
VASQAAVLLAVADRRASAAFRKSLALAGFTVTVVADAVSAVSLARRRVHRVLICDTDLPGLGEATAAGVAALLRARGVTLPLILMTPPGETTAMAGVEQLVKPVSVEQLVRRLTGRPAAAPPAGDPDLVYGELRLDPQNCRAFLGDYVVDLSAQECRVAEVFLRHPGRVLSRQELLTHAWGERGDTRSNVVDVHVRNLRKKLGAHRFVTVRGAGYRLAGTPRPR